MEEKTTNDNEVYIAFHPGIFKTKESFKMGKITSHFQEKGLSRKRSIKEIMEMSSKGRAFVPSNIAVDDGDYVFISSTLICIDIDDDKKVTNPELVLKELEHICCGLIFTPSHGQNSNNYRLLFVLDEPITNEKTYGFVRKYISEMLSKLNIPVDIAAGYPKQPVRTGTAGYLEGNIIAKVELKPILKEYERHQTKLATEEKIRLQKAIDRKETEITFAELYDRCVFCGKIDDRDEWINQGKSIKSAVKDGLIDDIEGFELFTILCDGNDEEVTWNSFNPTTITIKTFLWYTNKLGFKKTSKYYHAFGKNDSRLPIERKTMGKYIDKEYAKELIESKERIIVKSATGSGKTYSFVEAAKSLYEEKKSLGITEFYLFIVPTKAICDQVSEDRKIINVQGGTETFEDRLKDRIRTGINRGEGVFVCTYDKLVWLIDILQDMRPLSSFTAIVDEVHQVVHGYYYRTPAMEDVWSIKDKANAFIGLSGTPDDILRSGFDREVHIRTKDSKVPCSVWGNITFEKRDEEEPLLIQLIKQKVNSGKKLLVFVQNKEYIDRVISLLKEIGIKSDGVDAEKKNTSETYKKIVRESTFPSNLDVVLSTSSLSDGININNESIEYECIMVATQKSNMFNVDQARQCANRFRNDYRGFYVYSQAAKKNSKHLYNIESAFDYEVKIGTRAIDLINDSFKNGQKDRMRMSKLEKRFGIYLNVEDEAVYNELKMRYNISEEKRMFYLLFRNQFIEALQVLMEVPAKESINVSEYMREANIDISEMQERLEEEKLTAKDLKDIKFASISTHFTKKVYNAFMRGNEKVLKEFKKEVAAEHYACLDGVVPLLDYEDSMTIVKQVTNRTNQNLFKKRILAKGDDDHFNKIKELTPTLEALQHLDSYVDIPMTKEELDVLINSVSLEFRRSKKVDIAQLVNSHYYQEHTRTKVARFRTLRKLTYKGIAAEFEISEESVERAVRINSKIKDLA